MGERPLAEEVLEARDLVQAVVRNGDEVEPVGRRSIRVERAHVCIQLVNACQVAHAGVAVLELGIKQAAQRDHAARAPLASEGNFKSQQGLEAGLHMLVQVSKVGSIHGGDEQHEDAAVKDSCSGPKPGPR